MAIPKRHPAHDVEQLGAAPFLPALFPPPAQGGVGLLCGAMMEQVAVRAPCLQRCLHGRDSYGHIEEAERRLIGL